MGQYRPTTPPAQYDAAFQMDEARRVAQAFTTPDNLLILDTLHAAPIRLRPGMIVLADGVDWNPGSGAGVYAYYNAAWQKLG